MNTTTAQTMTIGNGTAVHFAAFVGENLVGSLCNRFAWNNGSRVRLSAHPATCPKCVRLAQS